MLVLLRSCFIRGKFLIAVYIFICNHFRNRKVRSTHSEIKLTLRARKLNYYVIRLSDAATNFASDVFVTAILNFFVFNLGNLMCF